MHVFELNGFQWKCPCTLQFGSIKIWYTVPAKVPQRCSQLSFSHGTSWNYAPQLLGKVTPIFSPIVNAARKWKRTKKDHPKCTKHHENANRPNGFKLWRITNKTIYFDIKTPCIRHTWIIRSHCVLIQKMTFLRCTCYTLKIELDAFCNKRDILPKHTWIMRSHGVWLSKYIVFLIIFYSLRPLGWLAFWLCFAHLGW